MSIDGAFGGCAAAAPPILQAIARSDCEGGRGVDQRRGGGQRIESSARIAFGRSNIVLLSPSGDAMATFAPLDGLSLSVPLQAVEANIDNLAAATIDADTLRAGLVRRRL